MFLVEKLRKLAGDCLVLILPFLAGKGELLRDKEMGFLLVEDGSIFVLYLK